MKSKSLILLLLLATLILAACAASGGGEPAVESTPQIVPTDVITEEAEATATTQPQETEATGECPEATAETRLLNNAKHGYCLLYPVEYKVEKPNENETILVIGGLLNAGDPRLHVAVETANGRTAEEVADQLEADFAIPGMDIERSNTTVGGAEAVVLDNLPGQDINRRVVFSHDDLLYSLYFSPADESVGDAFTRMEALYEMVLNSFTFIPQSDEVVEECLEPNADRQPLRNEEHGYCLLYPSGYQVEQPTENETVFFVGSLQDVEHPKLFIEVQDASGRTAQQAADELMAEFEGFAVERSFGLTVGYEPAELLDKVPGQDLGRQVLVVHGDRLYKLTFIPDDPNLGDIYTQMEELYNTVINSFRFLPE